MPRPALLLGYNHRREFINWSLGDRIGYGQSREVFTNDLNTDTVFKFETRDDRFQNTVEWKVWNQFGKTPWGKKWLAPVLSISPNGLILMMRRTEPLPKHMIPKQVPHILCDLKLDNFGIMDGRVVCHDYGTLDIHLMAKAEKAAHRLQSWAHYNRKSKPK